VLGGTIDQLLCAQNKMDKKMFWENYYMQKIKFSNRSGSHRNCIRVFKNNTYEHERIKFDICLKLIKEGYTIWTECIFTTGQRADILAISGKHGYVIEIETLKSPKEMGKKLNQKYKYPDEFTLVVVNTKEFNIDKWNL